MVPAVRAVPAASRDGRRRRPRHARMRLFLHVVHARRPGDRARGLPRGAARERGATARAARCRTPRGRPVVRATGRDPRRRRVARPQSPAGTAGLPPFRRRAERRRLPSRQLRSSRAAAADLGRLRHPHPPLLARHGRRDRRPRRRVPLASRPGGSGGVPDAPALRQLRAPDVGSRRRAAGARDRRSVRRARTPCRPGRDRARERLRPPADRARAACDPHRARPDVRSLVPDRPLRRAHAVARGAPHARRRARREPVPERPARRQLRADLPQAGERARRTATALHRDRGRIAHAARGCAVSGCGSAAGVARSATEPPARLDLRLLV